MNNFADDTGMVLSIEELKWFCFITDCFFCSTRWHSDPFIQGAYSYISTDCDNNDIISDCLISQAITYDDFYSENEDENKGTSDDNPIVLFAGEACHEKYFSTAHGAFLSGISQAQSLISSFIPKKQGRIRSLDLIADLNKSVIK